MSRRARGTGLGALLGAALFASETAAQAVPEFNKLRTPVSPAFMILDVTPAQVERPTVPASFAASLLQRAQDFSSTLPRSFAIEVAPYWWASHPGLTFSAYERGGWASLYRNFTLSLATTDSAAGGIGLPEGDGSFRRLGIGVRTMLAAGDPGARSRACVADVAQAAVKASRAVGAIVAAELARNPAAAGDAAALEKLRGRAYESAVEDSLSADEREALQEKSTECAKELSARRGFVMNIAAASALTFPNGRAAGGGLSSVGAWLTPALLGNAFSNIGVIRLRWDGLDADTTTTVLDLGARSVYAWRSFAASAEVVYRRLSREDDTDGFVRLSATFDTKLTDDTWLTLTFGKDFDPQQENSVLALLGLQWQIGDRSVRPDL